MFAARQRFVMGGQRSSVDGWQRGNTAVSITSTPSKFTNLGSLDVTNNTANSVLYSGTATAPTRGTSIFTIEAWFYPTVRSNNFPCAFTNDNGSGFGSGDWGIYPGHNIASTKWQWYMGAFSTGGPMLTSTSDITYNAWTHIAITRNASNRFDLWVNGTTEANATSSASLDNGTAQRIWFGSVSDANLATKWRGYICEARMSNSVRYTTGFTAPTEPFIDDPNTLLLFHGTGPATNFIDDNT